MQRRLTSEELSQIREWVDKEDKSGNEIARILDIGHNEALRRALANEGWRIGRCLKPIERTPISRKGKG